MAPDIQNQVRAQSTWSRKSLEAVIRVTMLLFCMESMMVSAQGRDSPGSMVYYTRIDELPENVVVGNVIRDANLHREYDQDVLDTFVLEIIGGEFKEYFKMDTEVVGNLKTAKFLDRDWVCRNLQDCHLALDIAVVRPQHYFQIIKVTLTLLDNNDNSPKFSEPVTTIRISENAIPPVSFVLPTASDPDSGLYGIQSYSIIRRSVKFDLELMDSGDGGQDLRLKLLDRLNREDQATYNLQVQARDGGLPPKIGLLDIQVIVADANDNTPVFQRPIYNITVRENHPLNSAFLQVRATDPDQGPNGQVMYSLASQTLDAYGDIFTIDSDSGELMLISPLDYETQTNYHLLVTAQDQGPDSVPIHARVVLQVLDVNDFTPQIAINSWTTTGRIEVMENEVGSFVAHVSVDDKDLGPSGQVLCELTDIRYDMEYMYTNTFKIVTAAMLDREEQDTTSLTVICTDRGSPPLSTESTVIVHILDQNDQTPQFMMRVYDAEILETSAIGASVIQVVAHDDDVGKNAQITFHLHANSNNMLRIDPSSGVITTNSLLDHEEFDSLDFYVLAVDNGEPANTATATVSLYIVDVNDEQPVFKLHSYSFGTLENQPVGTEIGTIEATDRDASPNDEFLFSINDNSTFSIHPVSGLITSNKQLDREHKASFYLVVTARNIEPPYLSATVSLTIHVGDKNDNAPRITFPNSTNNTVELSAYSPIGYIVTRIKASDVDLGNNAKLDYSFGKGNDEQLFSMDPFTGIVKVEGDLADSVETDFELLVLVRDYGESQKSAVATLNIVLNRTAVFAMNSNIPQKPTEGSSGFLGLGYHEKILIIIGAITIVVVTLLIVAIICIKHRQGDRERDSYKYMCRVDMAANAGGTTKVIAQRPGQEKNGPVVLPPPPGPPGSGDNADRMVKFSLDTPYQNTSSSTLSLQHGNAQPVAVVMSSPHHTPTTPLPPTTTTHSLAPCPLHGNRSTSLGSFQRPSTERMAGDHGDSDSTSGCSADMSNSDSGRGPSEEGEAPRYHLRMASDSLPRRHPGLQPHLPPRTTSLTKAGRRQHTGCHGYGEKGQPPKYAKEPRNFRNVQMNYPPNNKSSQNLGTFSNTQHSPPMYKNITGPEDKPAINV